MRMIKNDDRGVSAIGLIIIIGMIGTVVLAGTLYVMTIGMGGAGGISYSPTPPYDYPYDGDLQPTTYPEEPSKETYTSAVESQDSTFGADVDTGSYVYSRNCINYGRLPEPERVRTEEFLNYFDYHYPQHSDRDFNVYAEAGPSYFGEGYQMLKVGIRARSVSSEERGPMTLICVIDTSGSMASEGKLALIKQALPFLVDQLIDGDKFGIVTYGTTATNYLYPTGIDQKNRILESIKDLSTEGSTNAQDGLIKGYEMALEYREEGRASRLLLLSDGVANTGVYDVDGLVEMIQEYKNMDIYLSTYGFGMGEYNDMLMEQLADNGDGKYGYIDTLDEAKREFVSDSTGTLVTVAKDLKLNMEFNPETVAEYRLLGYENRLMTIEEFEDDTKDSGDIGAGHTVTALFEIKLAEGAKQGIVATLHIRYIDPETEEPRAQNDVFKVESIQSNMESTSPQFRFALSVAEFAEHLAGSTFCDSSMEEIHELAEASLGEFSYQAPEEIEFVDLVEKAMGVIDENNL